MTIIVYISSVTIKKEVHAYQNHIQTVLTAKKVPYSIIDIATDVSKKDEMREKCGNETAVAPQLFNEDTYLGFNSTGHGESPGRMRADKDEHKIIVYRAHSLY